MGSGTQSCSTANDIAARVYTGISTRPHSLSERTVVLLSRADCGAGCSVLMPAVINEALRLMLATRPQLRLEAAVQLFKDATVTLGRAAELAGITRWEFETILADRGIERVVACDAAEHLERQGESLRQRE